MRLTTTRRTDVPPRALYLWGLGLVVLAGLVYWSPLIFGLLMVAITLAFVGVWLGWRQPGLGLLAIGFLISEIIPSEQTTLSLGGTRVHPEDLLVLGVVALFVVWGVRRGRMVVSQWIFVGPLAAFAGFAFFSALYALFGQRVDPVLVMGELRPAVYCMGCAIGAMMIVRRDQLVILLAGLFLLADLTVAAIVVHQFIGVPPSIGSVPPSGEWQIDAMTGFGGAFGSIRVVPPAHVLVYLMENVACCLVLRPPQFRGARAVLMVQCVFLGVGLLLTYTRAQWVATGIALVLAVVFLPPLARKTLGRCLYVVVPVVAILLGLVGGGVIGTGSGGTTQALISRAASIITPNSTLNTASLQWRAFEDQAALNAISAHPFLGVGIGNDYRNITLLQGEASGWLWDLGGPSRLTRMAHNSYFYLTVKMGIPSLLAFFWFAIAFLVGGTRVFVKLPDGPEKLIVLATVASLPGILFWAIFEAQLMRLGGMVAIGLMVGIVVAIASINGIVDAETTQPAGPARSEAG